MGTKMLAAVWKHDAVKKKPLDTAVLYYLAIS